MWAWTVAQWGVAGYVCMHAAQGGGPDLPSYPNFQLQGWYMMEKSIPLDFNGLGTSPPVPHYNIAIMPQCYVEGAGRTMA